MGIGTLPAHEAAPQEYRYMLDAAASFLAHAGPTILRAHVPALAAEGRQRLSIIDERGAAALYIEPPMMGWEDELRELALLLPPGAPLAVVASRPLARLLPERRGWPGEPLGLQFGGIAELRGGLKGAGFAITAEYGSHTVRSIALITLSRLLERRGRADLADRRLFAARERYASGGGSFSTVALLLAHRGGQQ